ncbi:PUA domain protein [Treponema primitia ZAS-2]|uniref:PUA domain protein n=1 Tax=Treponema primitia (strain ATCC BAA-887 / DSM 12427 / ZAS-2) TaxID=545694 RepID=F5YK17_TREPZ|nr:class I SAM-dependent rRNA methyltransferase [Treponema primitia]AEF85020.1 PUA domain protein [Treponema primitia ZAS-2]
MKRIILKPGEEGRIRAGHPWVYDNEVGKTLSGPGDAPPAVLVPGEIADVESSRKEYLGRALVNPNSKIIARIYSPSKEGMDKGFFKRRIREAINRRFTAGLDLCRESARLVFAEADFLPGLIIDRFTGWPLEEAESRIPERPLSFEALESALGSPRSWLAVQFLVYGMDSRREDILSALDETLGAALGPNWDITLGKPEGIIEKSAEKMRELEGFPLREDLVWGSYPAGGIVIFEKGLPFVVHPGEGQKTGHFLDQRDNRLRAASFAAVGGNAAEGSAGARVLDACAYTGGFGIHAARAGAASVTCVDVSAAALETLRENAALNGVGDRITTLEADVFEYLRACDRQNEKFDLIILDPPAFAKSRSALEGALRGYKEINLSAIKLLNPGGVLVSCSCSHALDESRFKRMITEAAADAERRLIQLDFRYQGPDHPVLVGYDESLYLKCGFYRVI